MPLTYTIVLILDDAVRSTLQSLELSANGERQRHRPILNSQWRLITHIEAVRILGYCASGTCVDGISCRVVDCKPRHGQLCSVIDGVDLCWGVRDLDILMKVSETRPGEHWLLVSVADRECPRYLDPVTVSPETSETACRTARRH